MSIFGPMVCLSIYVRQENRNLSPDPPLTLLDDHQREEILDWRYRCREASPGRDEEEGREGAGGKDQ